MNNPEQYQGGLRVNKPARYDRVRRVLGGIVHGMRLKEYGTEKFEELAERGNSKIVVSTHRSNWDIPVLGAANNEFRMQFMAKKELEKVPYLGGLMHDIGTVVFDRNDPEARSSALRQTVDVLDGGGAVTIYGPGTRSRGSSFYDLGEIQPGAAIAALRADAVVDILPVSVQYKGQLLGNKMANPIGAVIVAGEIITVSDTVEKPGEDEVGYITNQIYEELSRVDKIAYDIATT